MRLQIATDEQLDRLWSEIESHNELHCSDDGPKNLVDFKAYLYANGVLPVSVTVGKKWVGGIGVHVSSNWIKGIHFIKEVRGTDVPFAAVKVIIDQLKNNGTVYLKYFADNPYIPGFVKKLGGKEIGYHGEANRNGAVIKFRRVEFS